MLKVLAEQHTKCTFNKNPVPTLEEDHVLVTGHAQICGSVNQLMLFYFQVRD